MEFERLVEVTMMLKDRQILICEDEYHVAMSIEDALEAEGARILGPVGTVEAALELLWSNVFIDAAIVDLNLIGGMSFPIAEKLSRHRIPFLFCTGSDNVVLPGEFRHAPILLKPFGASQMARIISTIIDKEAFRLAIDT